MPAPAPPPVEAYYRVWYALAQTEADHQKFHKALWAPSDAESRVTKAITIRVGQSPASEVDKSAVLDHLGRDWPASRILATLASSTTCFDAMPIPARLTALRERAGLSIPELARQSELSDDAIRLYESGKRAPTWESVQLLARALGVSTDTFRDR